LQGCLDNNFSPVADYPVECNVCNCEKHFQLVGNSRRNVIINFPVSYQKHTPLILPKYVIVALKRFEYDLVSTSAVKDCRKVTGLTGTVRIGGVIYCLLACGMLACFCFTVLTLCW
jgi:hypothetical protein